MGQYDSVYKLTVEEKEGLEKRKVTEVPIEAGKVFDSEGVLHVEKLRDIYDIHVKRNKGDESKAAEDKAGKKKAKKK